MAKKTGSRKVSDVDTEITNEIATFLATPPLDCGPLYNERSLQLELGVFLRSRGFGVEFERPFRVEFQTGSTRKPKRDLDIIAVKEGTTTAIELKVPLSGRVPETMYDFCTDVAFVESIVRMGAADKGICLLVTNERQFWYGVNEVGIYSYFRGPDVTLGGMIQKPTGGRDTTVSLLGQYQLAPAWRNADERLMQGARYLMVEVTA